jgi:hypothetical protein
MGRGVGRGTRDSSLGGGGNSKDKERGRVALSPLRPPAEMTHHSLPAEPVQDSIVLVVAIRHAEGRRRRCIEATTSGRRRRRDRGRRGEERDAVSDVGDEYHRGGDGGGDEMHRLLFYFVLPAYRGRRL